MVGNPPITTADEEVEEVEEAEEDACAGVWLMIDTVELSVVESDINESDRTVVDVDVDVDEDDDDEPALLLFDDEEEEADDARMNRAMKLLERAGNPRIQGDDEREGKKKSKAR